MIEICIDSCGFLVQAFESSRLPPLPSSTTAVVATPPIHSADAETIRRVASELPFEESHVLWLIDVCGCSYADAAQQSCVDADTIRSRVANGRHRLRAQLA